MSSAVSVLPSTLFSLVRRYSLHQFMKVSSVAFCLEGAAARKPKVSIPEYSRVRIASGNPESKQSPMALRCFLSHDTIMRLSSPLYSNTFPISVAMLYPHLHTADSVVGIGCKKLAATRSHAIAFANA